MTASKLAMLLPEFEVFAQERLSLPEFSLNMTAEEFVALAGEDVKFSHVLLEFEQQQGLGAFSE